MTRLASTPGLSSAQARFAVLVCAVLQIITPLLPEIGIGRPIGSQSDSVRTLLTPSGWAFSIWGLLYFGSTAFAIYQFLPQQRQNALLANIRWPAAGAFLGNALWAAYTQVFGLTAISSVIIVFTLGCLLSIYRCFSGWNAQFGKEELWLAVVPLSALTAWLTVATIVNITASLRFHGIDAGDAAPLVGAGVLIVAGLIAASALVAGRGNLPFALVFWWALAAIFAYGGQQSSLIAAAAGIAAVLVAIGLFFGRRRLP